MAIAIVTGSAGLVGSAAVVRLARAGFTVVGLDNNLRAEFFGSGASTEWCRRKLEAEVAGYRHYAIDIRNQAEVERLFVEYSSDIEIVVHTAAQPSHDWAAKQPHTDFAVNATGTLNLLEATRQYASTATFIFTSTNKVYGDTPNLLPLVEHNSRFELSPQHPYATFGIDETMSTDQTTHSLFGVSKLAADSLVQEYGRYFGLKTGCFRGGCLTGPSHAGAMLHGFVAYLCQCAVAGQTYTILGHKGKQVRDNLHAEDLVEMFMCFHHNPRPGEVYNVGGSRYSNCSILEAIALVDEIVGKKMEYRVTDEARIGDHIWYISDIRKFQSHYPKWSYRYSLRQTIEQILVAQEARQP